MLSCRRCSRRCHRSFLLMRCFCSFAARKNSRNYKTIDAIKSHTNVSNAHSHEQAQRHHATESCSSLTQKEITTKWKWPLNTMHTQMTCFISFIRCTCSKHFIFYSFILAFILLQITNQHVMINRFKFIQNLMKLNWDARWIGCTRWHKHTQRASECEQILVGEDEGNWRLAIIIYFESK